MVLAEAKGIFRASKDQLKDNEVYRGHAGQLKQAKPEPNDTVWKQLVCRVDCTSWHLRHGLVDEEEEPPLEVLPS